MLARRYRHRAGIGLGRAIVVEVALRHEGVGRDHALQSEGLLPFFATEQVLQLETVRALRPAGECVFAVDAHCRLAMTGAHRPDRLL